MWNNSRTIGLSLFSSTLLASILLGCADQSGGRYREYLEASVDPETIEFADDLQSNRDDIDSLRGVEFVDSDGNTVTLEQYTDAKNVLLVFTRGFSGKLCPFCTTQTSRLISNYDQFVDRDTEVLLVYPGGTEQLADFKRASLEQANTSGGFPFPVLLDENLNVVRRLGIEDQLAFPSTFLIDKRNQVRFGYVGSSPSDRPSIKLILEQMDMLTGKGTAISTES